MSYPKRLIEIDLPISRISTHARREKSIRHGHISTLHIWWARRPLAACRAVICAALWPDPEDLAAWLREAEAAGGTGPMGPEIRAPRGCKPGEGVTIRPRRFLDEALERMLKWATQYAAKSSVESMPRITAIQRDAAVLDDPVTLRAVLLDFIADFANWDNSTDAAYLETARALTQAAHEALGGEPGTRPMVVDPFAGGGSIPLEALRVGADAFASDLNPIPVLLNKVVLEYIPKYGQRLADEVRKWGQWIKEQAEKELSAYYPSELAGPAELYGKRAILLSNKGKQGKVAIVDDVDAEVRDHADRWTHFVDLPKKPADAAKLVKKVESAAFAALPIDRKLSELGARTLEPVQATPIAYLWARTILSEAPGQSETPVEVPLMRSLWLAKKAGRKRALRWVRDEKTGKVKTQPVEVTYREDGQAVARKVKRPLLEIFEPKKDSEVEGGTVARGSATCPVTGFTTKVDSVRAQLKKRRGGAADARLFCVVTTRADVQGRFYRLPTKADTAAFDAATGELELREKEDGTSRSQAGRRSAEAPDIRRSLVPDEVISLNELRRVSVPIYGMERWGDLFSPRQALALTTLARLVRQAAAACAREALNPVAPGVNPGSPGMTPGGPGMTPGAPGMSPGHPGVTPGAPAMSPGRPGMTPGGPGMTHSQAGMVAAKAGSAFLTQPERFSASDMPARPVSGLAEAVATCLACAVDRESEHINSLGRWNGSGEKLQHSFGRQAIGMVWDFCEGNPFGESVGSWDSIMDCVLIPFETATHVQLPGHVEQTSATAHPLPDDAAAAFVTDPPYYDAVPYAYLSDFFYVWMRRTLADIHLALFREPGVPKDAEIVVDRPHQLSKSTKDIAFYERELTRAFAEGRRVLRPDGIATIVFASKTTASWEAILKAVIDAGFVITGSWPIDTEMETRVAAQGQARLGSSVHIACRPRENPDGSVRKDDVGDWRDVLAELPRRIHDWMPRLAAEGVVGADAIFACLGPALDVFSRYSRVEKASGEVVTLGEYLEQVWAAVSKEALSLLFSDADAAGLEPDARLTAMWLWTLSAGTKGSGVQETEGDAEEAGDEDDEDGGAKKGGGKLTGGYVLEFDAARKIAQGLGAHLDKLPTVVEVKGDKARLLPVAERTGYLFGREQVQAPAVKGKRKKAEATLFQSVEEIQGEILAAEAETAAKLAVGKLGATVLDRVHQAMLLFAAGRSEALRRFLVDDGAGKDARFWKLADNLSKLYPSKSDEKRWVDGVLGRKKGLGL